MVSIKSPREIAIMRESGKILAKVHSELEKVIRPGVSTADINALGHDLITKAGGKPSFLNYEGYPASVCISVNDEVVHGIPSKSRLLREGDIVGLDAGVYYKGYHTDAARTLPVGRVSDEAKLLIERTKEAFYQGMKMAVAGNFIGQVSNAIAAYAQSFGYGVVTALVGHGVGKKLHEDPEIPNFSVEKRGLRLRRGMTLAIEPMINLGRPDVRFLDDLWTCVTDDGTYSAHYENTILVTDNEPEILTLEWE